MITVYNSIYVFNGWIDGPTLNTYISIANFLSNN